MDFRFLLARRYLAGRRRVTLISVISGVSVAGVGLGVAALVVVLSVMNGFYEVVRGLLVAYDPHVRIEATDPRGLTSADSLAAVARRLDHVVSAAPYVEGKALLTSPDAPGLNLVVTVRGVDPRATGGLETAMTQGTSTLDASTEGPGLAMGSGPASRAALFPGEAGGSPTASRVVLLSAPALERALAQYPLGLPASRSFALRGVFTLDPTYDEDHVFVGLEEAQQLFRTGSRVSGVDLRLDDLESAASVQRALERQLDPARYRVRTWYDLQSSLYGVMRLEKWAASAILALIIVVAAFNIVGALTMIVIEKQRDLAVLRAMGATPRDVKRIFLIEGLLVGVVGTGIGLVGGLGLALAQKFFGLVKLAGADAFVIEAYPVAIRPTDVLGVTLLAVALCAVAALYPAARAAAASPADAVRSAG